MQRRLVKSPPELWAEVSDPDALGRHLDLFGEIRISRLEPESTVAWEGERASGTVVLDSTGWGTKVTLTAEMREPAMPDPAPGDPAQPGGSAPAALDAEPADDTTPVAATEQAGGPAADCSEPAPGRAEPPAPRPATPAAAPPRARPGLLRRLFGRRRHAEPELEPQLRPEPEPVAAEPAAPPPVAPEPELVAAPVEPPPEPEPVEPELDVQTALTALEGVLDTLGAAHHRPFSR